MKGQSKTATTATAYLAELKEPRRSEVVALHRFIRKAVPGLKPFIHAGMLAYGPTTYRAAAGREARWFKIGVASNASAISLYACAADARGYVAERYKQALPNAKIGKSCVRFKRFSDLDSSALTKLLKETERTGFTPGR